MKSKLIMLSGPLGIGKSTIAALYADDHPLTLNLDIDNIWAMLSHWREKKEVSAPLSKAMALAMARVNLRAGHDVIVPQILQTTELADVFKQLGQECSSEYYEILLIVDKDEAIRRYIKRGQECGHPTGFRAGGIIDTGGREKKLAEMYDNMVDVAGAHPDTIMIQPVLGDAAGTYSLLLEKLG